MTGGGGGGGLSVTASTCTKFKGVACCPVKSAVTSYLFCSDYFSVN